MGNDKTKNGSIYLNQGPYDLRYRLLLICVGMAGLSLRNHIMESENTGFKYNVVTGCILEDDNVPDFLESTGVLNGGYDFVFVAFGPSKPDEKDTASAIVKSLRTYNVDYPVIGLYMENPPAAGDCTTLQKDIRVDSVLKKQFDTLFVIGAAKDVKTTTTAGEGAAVSYNTQDQLEKSILIMQEILGMINEPGLICLDYHDIKQFFTNGGYGYCAYLEDIEENGDNSSGHYRMICGDPDSLKMLDSAVISIRGNLSVDRVYECIESFRKYSSENVNVIFSLSEAGNGQAHAIIFGTAGKKEGI